ncbi:hypothetical protein SAMN05216404_1166 [Nitrosospira multiformis]|uniref:Transposase n=1 Tax=Nitrosospira multiformis TaxID=1231 RepID=A0A1H8NDK6_9PROT|nr:hypothetical protein [Nitrosospira multiformis]SEO27675.1 hypothetical protein SAMN05216404_1166 [Nitrosospira multiformis]
MKKQNKFSPEVRERAVRMVLEHRGEYPSLWATIELYCPLWVRPAVHFTLADLVQ